MSEFSRTEKEMEAVVDKKRPREEDDEPLNISEDSKQEEATDMLSKDVVDFFSQNQFNKQPKKMRASTVAGSGNTVRHEVEQSRTVYMGGLPPGVTFREIFDALRNTGPIESVRMLADKDCAFVDFCSDVDAEKYRLRFRGGRKLNIRGVDVKVSMAKPSRLNEDVVLATRFGATRNVYFSGIDLADDDEEGFQLWECRLRQDCERFGPVDMVKVVPSRGIAFVHMTRILDAMQAVSWLSAEPAWAGKRVNFGSDRCSCPSPDQREYPDMKPSKRTIYFGGIPKDATLEDICQVVRGGVLDQIKYMPEKSSAFATFVLAEAAEKYHTWASRDGVQIKGCRVKVSYATERALTMHTVHALQKGATRCVCIDNLDVRAIPLPELCKDLEHRFGEIECAWKSSNYNNNAGNNSLVNKAKQQVYVAFASIKEALACVDGLRFDRAFSSCKVNFGRDRCSLPIASVQQSQQTSVVSNMEQPMYAMVPGQAFYPTMPMPMPMPVPYYYPPYYDPSYCTSSTPSPSQPYTFDPNHSPPTDQ